MPAGCFAFGGAEETGVDVGCGWVLRKMNMLVLTMLRTALMLAITVDPFCWR